MAIGLVGLLVVEWLRPSHPVVVSVDSPREACWISSVDEVQTTACFRHDFELKQEVVGGWLAVAAEGGFELVCNGNSVGMFSLWRSTRPFQNGLSEAGQRIYGGESAMSLNFPREYQWELHANEKLPVWFDLRPFLRRGWNALALELEARKPGAAMIVWGEVTLEDGSVVEIHSGRRWLAEPVPKGTTQFEWTRPEIRLRGWRQALEQGHGGRRLFRSVPDAAFGEAFDAPMMVSPPGRSSSQDWVLQFDHPHGEGEAFLRILANGPYRAWLNGRPIQPDSRASLGLADGGWQVTWEGRRPLAVTPTLMDPDDLGQGWGGERFADPRHGDPTANELTRVENMANQTRERPTANRQGQLLYDQYGEKEEKGRESDPKGYLEEPIRRTPMSVARDRSVEQFSAFGVGRLLVRGKNELRVRTIDGDDDRYGRTRSSKLAVDGWERTSGDWRNFTGDGVWQRTDPWGVEGEVVRGEPLNGLNAAVPAMKFLGHAGRPTQRRLVAPLLMLLVFAGSGLMMKRCVNASFSCWLADASWMPPVLVGTLVIVGFHAVKAAMLERSELLFFHTSGWPLVALSAALLVALMVRCSMRGSVRGGSWVERWERPLVVALLIAVAVLRGWKMDYQPIDDDEFASIQAVVGIAEKGVPEIGEGIWYTRSPLYHYAAGLLAWMFGSNLWVLRGFSVLAGVATGWVLWAMAKSIFKDPRIAMGALVLYALHPFLIFSSHIARFYQQQQLFLLLGIWAFIRGFVDKDGSDAWRLGSLAAFTAAILSQEISITMAPVILLVFVLFGRKAPWRSDLKLVLASGVAGLAVFIDILAFQVKCMTRSVGVSPNVEATISPTFWELGNLGSMAIGYSRLHVVLSLFVLFSLIAGVCSKQRGILALQVFVLGGIVACNLLITSVSFRYQYTLIALWILLGVHGMAVVASWLAQRIDGDRTGLVRRWVGVACFLMVLVSWSPWRIPGSYDEKILGDPITPLRHVAAMERPGDKVMITEPHPHAAKMEVGHADYDLVVPLLHDFTYRDRHGVLRDRNGDAEVVNHIGRLQEVFSRGDRIWIVVNREKFRSRGKNLRWEYPGAREELFIRKNCELVFRSHLWNLYLWDPAVGRYHAFRQEPGGWVD
ncbi:glycosyltransferase family 39 protein [Haloferula rosea]|uniref:glycosyltransferase family 39 protein n=1 Tax=Haloferula rosea TaxID=490093 RepID=UPI002D7FD17C|nr:glycosyltransferase family 39 protein [Haloferula rosea]